MFPSCMALTYVPSLLPVSREAEFLAPGFGERRVPEGRNPRSRSARRLKSASTASLAPLPWTRIRVQSVGRMSPSDPRILPGSEKEKANHYCQD